MRAGGAAGACCCCCCCGAGPAAAACAKVFALPLPLPVTSTQSSAWIRGALEGAGVLRLGGCCGSCSSCAYWASVWLLMCLGPPRFIAPGRSEAGEGGAYPCWYGCGCGLGGRGAGAGVFCGRAASCYSLVTPTLILLVSSARKLTVLVVEACFSARPMIWVWRDWMAARITVITSRLVGSLVVAPSIRLSADCGSSIEWLITCAHPSVMIWFGWLLGCGRGGLCMYSCKEGKLLVPGGRGGCCCSRADTLAAYSAGVGRPLERAAEAAAAAAGTLVDDGRGGRFFFPTRDAVREMGAGVGLLAWLRSSGFVRVREAVGTCIWGGGGRALGVMWGSASISESESPSFSSPQSAGGTFLSAPHSPIWGGRTGVGDHVSGLELMGSGELPRSCGLPDIFWREAGTLVLSPSVPGAGPQISQRMGRNRLYGQ